MKTVFKLLLPPIRLCFCFGLLRFLCAVLLEKLPDFFPLKAFGQETVDEVAINVKC